SIYSPDLPDCNAYFRVEGVAVEHWDRIPALCRQACAFKTRADAGAWADEHARKLREHRSRRGAERETTDRPKSDRHGPGSAVPERPRLPMHAPGALRPGPN